MIINEKEMIKISKITNSFYEDLKVEFLFHSNHLEGSTFSRENLETLLLNKKVQGEHFFDDVIETRNSLDVFDKVIASLEEPLNKFLLFDWHRTLKKGSVDDEIHNIGRWKQFENRLKGVPLRTAQPYEVDQLMYNLIEDWNDMPNHSLEDIAMFHARFEAIHPFQDGNGHIGRFLILKQCINSGVDLISIDSEYEKEYKDSLFVAQTTGDFRSLCDVFEACQKRLDEKMAMYASLLQQVHRELSDHEDR